MLRFQAWPGESSRESAYALRFVQEKRRRPGNAPSSDSMGRAEARHWQRCEQPWEVIVFVLQTEHTPLLQQISRLDQLQDRRRRPLTESSRSTGLRKTDRL